MTFEKIQMQQKGKSLRNDETASGDEFIMDEHFGKSKLPQTTRRNIKLGYFYFFQGLHVPRVPLYESKGRRTEGFFQGRQKLLGVC